MRFIRRLMTKKITIYSRLKILFIGLSGLFPDGQGNCTVGVSFPYRRNNVYDSLIRKIGILSPLHHERPKTQSIPFLTTGKNLFLGKAITLHLAIVSLDSAIMAVILAKVRKFNQPSRIDSASVILLRAFSCQTPCKLLFLLRPFPKNFLIRGKA